MASTQLTDEEIFSELKRLGFTPGPVTENTRPVYLKKLKKLREEQQQRGSRAGKTRSSGASSGGAAGGGTAAFRPGSPDVTHLGTGRRPGQKSTVLGFSSDESDAETPLRRKDLDHSVRAYRSSVAQQQAKISPAASHSAPVKSPGGVGTSLSRSSSLASAGQRRVSLGWGVSATSGSDAGGRYYDESADEDDCEREPGKNSRSLNGRATSRLKSSKLAGDYSDSDEENVGGLGSEEGPRSERRGASLYGRGREKSGEVPPSGELNMLVNRGENEEEEEGKKDGGSRCRRFSRKSIYLSLADNHGGKAAKNNHVDGHEDGTSRSSGRFSSGLRPRFCNHSSLSQTYRANHSNHTPNHSHSQGPQKRKLSAPEDELLQQFKREEMASSGSFSAHYLSMVLLSAACLFFLLLGLVYLRMRGSASSEVVGVVKSHPFGENFDASYDKTEKDLILTLLLNLHDHLAFIAGQHDCGDKQHPNRSLSIEETSSYLRAQNEKFENLTLTSLEWIIRTGQDVGIRLYGQQAEHPVTDVSEISRLESTHPKMSFPCRFRRAFLTVISRVVLIAAMVGSVWGVVRYMKYRWRREEEETRNMYDMVERIIDVLRTHSDACQDNVDLLPYLPIPHVRDSLVPPQDRRKMKKIWDRAVSFLSANESRVRTESQRIGGADFMVWRWIQPSLTSEKTSLMPSKVWQGKGVSNGDPLNFDLSGLTDCSELQTHAGALLRNLTELKAVSLTGALYAMLCSISFPLDRRNSPPNSLTPCLKIRNMFDPVMEVGDNWDLAIHEAILEKCSDNAGIVHIAVDKNSREGCVYVKCLSAEHSGKAFKALHGSWFDGKLVTVKYLHLDRYHQRFPQAQGCSSPLKASSLHLDSTNSSIQPQQLSSSSSSGFS